MTIHASGVVDVRQRFKATIERVFDTWVDPDKAGKFLFATPTGQMVRVDMDARVGGSFVFTDRRNGEDIEHIGTFLEIDRPHRLVFEFAMPKFLKQYTRVCIDLKPLPTGCELKLTHEGVLPVYLDRTRERWSKIAAGLAAVLASSNK